MAIGTLTLAAATAALALSTRNLSRRTAEEVQHSAQLVRESQRQAEAAHAQARAAQEALGEARAQTRLSQITLEAQIRPVLVDVPQQVAAVEEPLIYAGRDETITGNRGAVHLSATDAEVLISVPMRNAGAGLAMIRGVGINIGAELGQPSVMILPTNIAPGELGRVNFRAIPGNAAFAPLREVILRQGNLSVEVAYSDLAGQQLTVSRFDVYFRAHARWNWEVRQVHLQEPGADQPFAGSAPVA